jgi:hypothetical protein
LGLAKVLRGDGSKIFWGYYKRHCRALSSSILWINGV